MAKISDTAVSKSNGTIKRRRAATLFFFLKGSRRFVLLSSLFMLLGVSVQYLIPEITAFTVDNVLGGIEAEGLAARLARLLGGIDYIRSHFIIIGALLVVVAVFQALFAFSRRIFSTRAAEIVSKRAKDTLYAHIQRLPFSWHSKMSTGDIIQRATQDSDLIKRYVSQQLVELMRVVFMVVVGLTLMFLRNPTMTLIAMSMTPVTLITSIIQFPRISKRFKVTDEAEGALTAALQENLTGLRVVRTFGQQIAETERFEKQNAEYVKLWHRFAKTLSIFWSSGDLIAAVQALVILIVGAHMTTSGAMTTGALLLFISYNHMLVWPIRSVGRILAETGKVKIALGRLNEVLDAEPETDAPNERDLTIKGDVEFRDVSFNYDGERDVLKNVSFKIRAGQTFGIIGATGSGKSTLAALFNRLYEPTGGSVLIDDVDARDIRRSALRSQIGLILQEPFLFSKTLGDNITLALPDYDRAGIEHYLSISSLTQTVDELENGLQTIVGERGVTLSGGQKQRLVIARTLIQKPPIVIFDDSLSAVDTDTDYKIREALRQNLEGTTTVLISHRISSVMNADNILVLHDGSVEALGTHEQLLQSSPTYRNLYELQSLQEEDENA